MAFLSVQSVEKNGIHYHFIPTDKFKTITLVAKLKAPLNRETITKRALLPYVIQQGTVQYPSEKQLQEKLDNLYGALFHVTTTKKGEQNILHFQLELANEKFVGEANNITNEALQLFHEIIFSPLIKDDKLPKDIITREKRQLENKIKSIYDQKIAYANKRLIEEMFVDEPFSLHTDGYIEDLPSIQSENLADYYKTILKEDQFDLYVLGDFNAQSMQQTVTSLFKRGIVTSNQEKKNVSKSTEPIQPKRITEADAIQQAKLHIGYRTNILYEDDAYSALQVFNGLFGAFPNSKLFLNVREKHSLAYYIASRLESHIGLLLVYSGVDSAEYERTLSIVEDQFEQLRTGNFTDDELASVQNLIINNIKETLDHPLGTIELLYQQVIGEKNLSPDEFIKEIKEVTREDILEVAEQIQLDTIYILAREVGE